MLLGESYNLERKILIVSSSSSEICDAALSSFGEEGKLALDLALF